MFGGGARSLSVFPLRVVYMPTEEGTSAPVAVMISVSKRRFKRAVDRNRVKRLIREAYRLNKQPLVDNMTAQKRRLAMAFIYLSNELPDFKTVEARMKVALARVNERMTPRESQTVDRG